MSDAQTWVALASMFALFSATITMVLRVVRTDIGAVRIELRSEIGSVRSEIGSVRSEMESVRHEVSAFRSELGSKLDHLDRDVQTVINRMMGG